MGLLNKLFGKKEKEETRVGGVEDFMSLIRVYYQCVMASNLGITNLAMLPDLRVFKQTLHIPTVNNKLGISERNRCKKMLQDIYGITDGFFKEIDASIKRNCHKQPEIQSYLYAFQGFSQELMMLMGNLMQWKFRLPSFFRNALWTMTQKQVKEIMTKPMFKDDGVNKSVQIVRKYAASLGYSEQWMAEYVFNLIMLAKKEPNRNNDEDLK